MSEETPQGPPPEPQPTPPAAEAPPPAPPPPPPPAAVPPPRPAPLPPAPPRRASGWKWGCGLALGGCLFLILIFVILIAVAASSANTWGQGGDSRAAIALVRVEGAITSGSSDDTLFGGTTAGAEEIIRQIDAAGRDDGIKAILLRINSPGGSASASQEIYSAVTRARKQKKKVVVSMGDMAASGGYYVASAADKIYANPATATGSIGVIVEYANIEALMGKLGIKNEDFKSGKLKDMLSPTKPVSPEARAVIQGIIMDIYQQFVSAVADGRKGKLTRAQVLKLADGRIYSGTQAKRLKLIDELGGMQDALQGTANLVGISGRPTYRQYTKPEGLLHQLLSSNFGTRQKTSVFAVQGGILYDSMAAQLIPGPWQSPVRPGEP